MKKIRYDRTIEHLVSTGRLELMLKAYELLRKFNNLTIIAQEAQGMKIPTLTLSNRVNMPQL